MRINILVLAAPGIAVLGIAAVAGVILMNSTTENSFHERWNFNATLDRTDYHPGDSITLTVQLTCLIDHEVSDYNPGWFRWLSIVDSSNNTIWHPFQQRPEIIYPAHGFHAGDDLSDTVSFQLGTTGELPPDTAVDSNYWIPLLTTGDYHFIVDLRPLGPGFTSFPTLRIPFAIE